MSLALLKISFKFKVTVSPPERFDFMWSQQYKSSVNDFVFIANKMSEVNRLPSTSILKSLIASLNVWFFLFRPDLRVILMSATLNAEMFSQYFSKLT